MTHLSGGSHIGAILSVADIIAVLYCDILRYDSQRPKWDGRDRIILSKGHAGGEIYAALAECGFLTRTSLKRMMPMAAAFRGMFPTSFPE